MKQRTDTSAELVQFESRSDVDGLPDTGHSDEQLTLGHKPSSARAARWASVVLTLVLGFALGRHTASMSSSSSTPQSETPTAAPASAAAPSEGSAGSIGPNGPGCPPGHLCRAHNVDDPALTRFLALALPDIASVALTATEQADTSQRYQVSLVATLYRGATVRITTQDNSHHAHSSPWMFAARGKPTGPRSAQRARTDHRATGVIAYISLEATDPPTRPGRADFVCSWCQTPNPQELSTALRQLVVHAPSPLTAGLALAVDEIARGPALRWLHTPPNTHPPASVRRAQRPPGR
jgi:hypothetical protein